MTDQVDFSQFLRKDKKQSSEGDLDFSKFMRKKEKSPQEKAFRLGTQYAIGAAETAALPYELAVAPLASKGAQHAEYRKNIFEDIERLTEQKQTGVWDKQDEDLLQNLIGQIKHPEQAEKFVKTGNIGIGSLAEKASEKLGYDLGPEGFSEHAARIGGNIFSPKNAANLGKKGISLLSAEGRAASKWNTLKTAAKGNPEKESLLKLAENTQLSPEATTVLMQSKGKAEILGKIAKKSKKYKGAVSELHEKLGNNYEKLKEVGRSGGYIGAEASESLSNDLSRLIGDLEKTLVEGPDTKAAKTMLENALTKLENEGATIEDLINSRVNLGQSINWKNVDPKGSMLNRGRKILLDAIERSDPRVAEELAFTDHAWQKYKLHKKIVEKPKTINIAGLPIPVDQLAFGSAGIAAIKIFGKATTAKALIAKEATQHLATKLLIDPKLQGVHKRLVKSLVEGSKDKQEAAITVIKKILKKEDPDLYSDL